MDCSNAQKIMSSKPKANGSKNFHAVHLQAAILQKQQKAFRFPKNDIPAAEIPLGHAQKDANILSDIQDNLISARSQTWNKHYNFIPLGIYGLWLNEAQLTAIYIFLQFQFFFYMFLLIYIHRKNEAILKDMSRTWFSIPAYLIITAVFLTLFQKLFFSQQKTEYFTLG